LTAAKKLPTEVVVEAVEAVVALPAPQDLLN
jgi:hypothetical protein